MFGHDNNQQDDNENKQLDDLVQPGADETPSGEAVEIAPSAPAVDDNGTNNDSNDGPSDSVATPAPANPAASGDLLDIKQKALSSLSPLIDHLEQTPEERFRTTMMMIQATDNQALLRTAFETAEKIGDEKVRAQALLDVVNEINYFTQKDA